MEIYLAEQTWFFLQACLLGACLGLLYDAFRITRIAVPTTGWVIFAEDVLFFITCAVVSFFFMLRTIDGQLRFFILLGEGLGAILYFMGLSPIVMGVSKTIIRIVKAILRTVLRFLILPVVRIVVFFVRLLLRPFLFLGRIGKKIVQRSRFRLKVRRLVVYNHFKSVFASKQNKRKTNAHDADSQKGQT